LIDNELSKKAGAEGLFRGLECRKNVECRMTKKIEKRLLNSVADAVGVTFTKDSLVVALADGREVSAPLEWFPRLRDATAK